MDSFTVIQADREAAENIYLTCYDNQPNDLWCAALLAGKHDDDPVVQACADIRHHAAQESLDLGLANDPRTATPLDASEAHMALTTMFSHRGDGIPTQYVHGAEVARHAETMWLALLTALRATQHPKKD